MDTSHRINKEYELIGDEESFIVADTTTRAIVGAAFTDDPASGWWHCAIRGKSRRLYVAATTPNPHLEVARQMTQ
ncbi:hypothetical protein [Actinomadura litoris]|uniref:Uncharacterized protein n=1 Tax=Actinomadura litoris TaxID=2678616 RepID=A0A7K1L4Q6_9ACTN|nr:hypothetical protein [Actinomadura litoris]MUN39412.1 hypothetical protein [Actinomadura litoris]